MASIHWGLELVSGPDNIRALPKTATTGIWTKGDLLTLTSGKLMPRTAAGTSVTELENAFAGVALSSEATDANAETNNTHAPLSIITPEQVWSIKVADGSRAYDYEIGLGYEIGYYGTSTTAYDIRYASGETAITVTADDFYYLTTTEPASAILGVVVVAKPNRNIGADLDYGGRVHIRFNPAACMAISG